MTTLQIGKVINTTSVIVDRQTLSTFVNTTEVCYPAVKDYYRSIYIPLLRILQV